MGEYYELLKAKKMGAGGGGDSYTKAETDAKFVAKVDEYNAGKTVGTGAEIFNDYRDNKAVGDYSHAEGVNTTASGTSAHAEGGSTIASGAGSHVEGVGTLASGDYSHVEGKYNVSDDSGKFAFIIGNGRNSNSRSNAFTIDWDGKIYVNNSATGVDVSELDTTVTGINNVTYSNLIEYDLEGFIKKVNTAGTWEDNRYTINGVTFVFNNDGTVNIFGTVTEYTEVIYGSYCLQRKMPYLSLTGCPERASGINHYIITKNNHYDNGNGTVFSSDDTSYDNNVRIVLYSQSFNLDGLCFKPMLLAVPSLTVSKAEYIPYAPTTHELMIRSNAIMKGQAAYTTYRYASSILKSGVTRITMGSEYHLIDSTYDVVDNGFIYYNATAIPTHELTLENVALYDNIKRTPAEAGKMYVGDMKDNGYGATIRGFVTVSKNGTNTTYYADPMYAKYEEESENRSKEEDEHLKINSRECNAELD